MIIHSAVWGREYIKVFLNYCLPSLNISDEIDVKLIVHTRKSDLSYFDGLKKYLANFELKVISDSMFKGKTAIDIHTEIWEETRLLYCKEIIFNLAPDTIWSSGALSKILFDIESKRASLGYIHYLRVNQEDLLNDVEIKDLIGLRPQSLYAIGRKYSHQLHYCNATDAIQSSKWPEYVYENFGSKEVSKIFLKEPLFYEGYLSREMINDQILRKNVLFYGSTSDIFCLSLTPKKADVDWYMNRPEFSEDYISTWLINFDEKIIRKFEECFVIWSEDENCGESGECKSLHELAKKIIFKSSYYRLIQGLSDSGFYSQANFLMANAELYIDLAILSNLEILTIVDTGDQSGQRSHSSSFWPSFERDFIAIFHNAEELNYAESKGFFYSSESYLRRGNKKYIKVFSTGHFQYYAKR